MREVYDAFARGKIPVAIAKFSPDVIWEESNAPGIAWGGIQRGIHEIFENVFMKILANFSHFDILPEEYLSADDKMVISGTLRARSHNGREFEAPFVHIATFQGGKITRFRVFYDTTMMVKSLEAS